MKIMTVEINDETDEVSFTFDESNTFVINVASSTEHPLHRQSLIHLNHGQI